MYLKHTNASHKANIYVYIYPCKSKAGVQNLGQDMQEIEAKEISVKSLDDHCLHGHHHGSTTQPPYFPRYIFPW